MKRLLGVLVMIFWLIFPVHAQRVDLRPLSVTQEIEIKEMVNGKVTKTKHFTYELYFLDDGTPDTTQPIITAFKMSRSRVHHFERYVGADPYEDLTRLPEETDSELIPLKVWAVIDPKTGLPDHKIGSTVLHRNGQPPVTLSLLIKYRKWRKRAVTVTIISDEEPP